MLSPLASTARRVDQIVADARTELVQAVRAASRHGMTQTQIAREIGRSQPEVSRLLHFHGQTTLGRKLSRHRNEVRRLVAPAGGSDLRVFGSVATGTDGPDSDIDLIFTPGTPLSLMELGALETALSEVVGASVDLVPDTSLRPDLRERILTEAVLL